MTCKGPVAGREEEIHGEPTVGLSSSMTAGSPGIVGSGVAVGPIWARKVDHLVG
jgi:hypothetical protein